MYYVCFYDESGPRMGKLFSDREEACLVARRAAVENGHATVSYRHGTGDACHFTRQGDQLWITEFSRLEIVDRYEEI